MKECRARVDVCTAWHLTLKPIVRLVRDMRRYLWSVSDRE